MIYHLELRPVSYKLSFNKLLFFGKLPRPWVNFRHIPHGFFSTPPKPLYQIARSPPSWNSWNLLSRSFSGWGGFLFSPRQLSNSRLSLSLISISGGPATTAKTTHGFRESSILCEPTRGCSVLFRIFATIGCQAFMGSPSALRPGDKSLSVAGSMKWHIFENNLFNSLRLTFGQIIIIVHHI